MECCSVMVVVGGLVAKLCPTLSTMDCSLPGFSIHGISQASIPEWAAISFSRGSSQPRGRTQVSHTVGLSHQGSHQGKCVRLPCKTNGLKYKIYGNLVATLLAEAVLELIF